MLFRSMRGQLGTPMSARPQADGLIRFPASNERNLNVRLGLCVGVALISFEIWNTSRFTVRRTRRCDAMSCSFHLNNDLCFIMRTCTHDQISRPKLHLGLTVNNDIASQHAVAGPAMSLLCCLCSIHHHTSVPRASQMSLCTMSIPVFSNKHRCLAIKTA